MQPTRRLRGGIIGCGYFAQFQIEAWRRMPEVKLVAAADLDYDRARKAAPEAFDSAEQMLDKVRLDFVDIATRPEWHLPLVRLAAAHKLAVICQKPMAPTWVEAVEMVEVAERAGIRLMIHENWRWQPWYRKAKETIERGDIGGPIHYWFRTRRRDGVGAQPFQHQPYFVEMPRLLVYETLVHHIDTARFLFGDLETVYAQARRLNPLIAGEDQALILLMHQSGLMGMIDGHRYLDTNPDGPVMGEACFEGEEGALWVEPTGDVRLGRHILWTNSVVAGYRGDSVRATQQHFISCLLTGQPFETGAREYLKTARAVEAAYESIAHKRAVSTN